MKINWWGALVLGLGLTALLLPWGVCYNGTVWQNASLLEMLGRSGDLGLTITCGLFFISTLITVRTTLGGVGQVLSSILIMISSKSEVSYPTANVGVLGIPLGVIVGLVVGLLEIYLLWSYDVYYVIDDHRVGGSNHTRNVERDHSDLMTEDSFPSWYNHK